MAGQTLPNPPLLAVDTNVLIDRAARGETVLDCFATIRRKLPNAPIIVLPTVIAELADIAAEGESERAKRLAIIALRSIRSPWGLKPINYVPVGHGIVEETARKIRAAGLIPDAEINDSLIVAEAALANITVLLSSDAHLTGIDRAQLQRLLERCDLAGPVIASPWKIVYEFFNSA
jgi:predicted nucleic acid-binding protein